MKKLYVVIFILLPFLAFSQYKVFNVLDSAKYQNYREKNNFYKDSLWRFSQFLKYDEPYVVDEEWWQTLWIIVKDTAAFANQKKINLQNSSVIKCHYYEGNVWESGKDSILLYGEVGFISRTESTITLQLNLTAQNQKTKYQFLYKGERTFLWTRESVPGSVYW